jgi:hypothetical protein
MREIKKYRLVSGTDPVELQEKVNKHIKEEGWQPFGAFTIYYDFSAEEGRLTTGQAIPMQPMVKYEE